MAYHALWESGRAEPMIRSINLPGASKDTLGRAEAVTAPAPQDIERQSKASQCDTASLTSSRAADRSFRICACVLLAVFATLLSAMFLAFIISHHAK